MNMFTKDGKRRDDHVTSAERQLLTHATEPTLNAEEEAKERMLTEKAT